jgi:hypothetical protein
VIVIGVRVQDGALVPQEFEAVTHIFPAEEPNVTEIEAVVCPELITAPAGTVQLKDVAPAADVVYVCVLPLHTLIAPDGVLGVGGAEETAIGSQKFALVPQEPDVSLTQIFPDELPKVTEIEPVPCPELMTDPAGTVQL